MALHANDLLEPKGELNHSALWPKKSLSAVSGDLEEYLTEGYAKAADVADEELDEAARQWAYYRAYLNVDQRLNSRPASVQLADEGGASYLGAQLTYWGEKAAQALEKFEALTPEVEDEQTYPVITSLR
jgi:hypothetical protein